MPNQIKLLLTLLIALPLTARSAFYLEPRVSAFFMSGDASIGDLGRTIEEDLPVAAFTLALGYELTPKISLEVRYTGTGDDIVTIKQSPNSQIFPGGEVVLPVVRKYEFAQRTKLFTAALPVRVLQRGKLTLFATPMLQYEDSDVALTELIDVGPPLPNVLTLPPRIPLLNRRDTGVHVGAELSAAYELTPNAAVRVHYTYSPLSNLDAHLFGAGVVCRF